MISVAEDIAGGSLCVLADEILFFKHRSLVSPTLFNMYAYLGIDIGLSPFKNGCSYISEIVILFLGSTTRVFFMKSLAVLGTCMVV